MKLHPKQISKPACVMHALNLHIRQEVDSTETNSKLYHIHLVNTGTQNDHCYKYNKTYFVKDKKQICQ